MTILLMLVVLMLGKELVLELSSLVLWRYLWIEEMNAVSACAECVHYVMREKVAIVLV